MSTTDTTDSPIISVKIKQEKLDPEVERKLNSNILLPDSTNPPDGETEPQADEKKNIEPVKSSNEILAELFMVFNATPPEELLSNDKLTKKAKKEKKSKHKKKKKRKRKSAELTDISDIDSLASDEDNKHKRKKHKRKHKKSKDKSDEEEKPSATERTVIMAADSSSSSKLKQSIKKEPVDNIEIKVEKSSSKSESRSRIEERLRNCSHVDEGSDITLSDEETYLRERSRYKELSSTESASKRSKYDRYRNVFYRNSNNYYSSERQERDHHRHHHRSGSDSRTRSRSKSRSRSTPRDLGIDKKRLLEIARKNAISMFKSGSLPGCAGMSDEVKDKVLMKMRYGGKTVQDLTNFCRKLTCGDNYDDLSEFSSDEESDVDKQGNAKAFHHPFVLKDREPIVMHIKNATPIVPKTADQKKAITMQFPVSSGQQHRLTEGWVPVPTKEPEVPPPTPIAVKPAVTIKNVSVPKNVFQKQLPVEEQQPAFKPVNGVAPNAEAATPDTVPNTAALPTMVPPPVFAAPVVDAAPNPTIFPAAPPSVDVSTIISQRLSAMRRLQENPMDCEAIKMMYTSQKEMTSWASSKHMPGQFTGSTGANILTARELTSGSQAWARKDQLTSTVPVSGGMGMHLLKKMGWKPGEGLGREKTGSLQPLLLDVKLDKRGLEADEEINGNRPPKQAPNPKRKRNPTSGQVAVRQAIDEKHPVCLLNELSTKRKWTPPMYELVTDEGPSHSKFFVFSVNVNGQIFNPGTGGNTKKEAKMLAAKYCLTQIGVLS